MKSALEIGQYFIDKTGLANSLESNTKLQKLLFFSWLIHFYNYKESLFEDDFFAFEYGPVVENVRKSYKRNYADLKNKALPKYSEKEAETLTLTKDIFGDSDCEELVKISHKSPAWEKYFKNSIVYDSEENATHCTEKAKIPKDELGEEVRMIENVLSVYKYQNQNSAEV